MDEDDRVALLERVNRQSATVGASMPETITVGGDELALAQFLIETRKVDRIPPDTEAVLTEAKRTLEDERARRIERIESESLDRDTAEDVADEIVGIDRALNALENVRQPTYSEAADDATIEDHERWLGFLRTIRE